MAPWPYGSDALDIEKVQKAVLQIIFGTTYTCYADALHYSELDTLEGRRVALCEKFGKKAAKNEKHCNWFKPNSKKTITRQTQPKFCPVASRTRRFDKSLLALLSLILLYECPRPSKILCGDTHILESLGDWLAQPAIGRQNCVWLPAPIPDYRTSI